ncbi:hypothetical protein J7943_13495 [Vibrio parahaemolyticus]|uniref:hypothetical protein n=1 Tax=Vibrio parahaemolyticus TaxID=670 RepID=UPI001E2CBA23|nr:hypothetical protein [Vibrio parahaemolyticus]MCF9742830.1 hypothetical protein [Vibrio parahaemolyticus]
MKKVDRFGLKNITSKCVIDRQENYQISEGQFIEKVEITNGLGFKKVNRKVNPNLDYFYSKSFMVLI